MVGPNYWMFMTPPQLLRHIKTTFFSKTIVRHIADFPVNYANKYADSPRPIFHGVVLLVGTEFILWGYKDFDRLHPKKH